MSSLVIMRGLPASGKTTYARLWVAEDLSNRLRVNRDDLRSMLHDSVFIKGVTEQVVIRMRDKVIDEALCTGVSVISDDCNLSSQHIKELSKIAKRCGAAVEIVDLTNVSLEECIARNTRRNAVVVRPVPERFIIDMYNRYIKGKQYPLDVPEVKELSKNDRERYVPDTGLPQAVIFDIDGTVAHMNGRSPYDYTKVGTDTLDRVVAHLVDIYAQRGYQIIFLSGRKQECYDLTASWLHEHLGFRVARDCQLLMRKDGDNRDDAQVKYELFDEYVRNSYWVVCVFDDRNRVVDMWREIGLKCLQVAPGDF